MDFTEQYLSYINEKNHFMIYNHIRITKVEKDYAEAELVISEDCLNPVGLMHGGAYFTMADCAASGAARSNGLQYLTLNSSFEFIRSAKEGAVHATARVRHRGRTTCLVATEVIDEQGTLLAEGKFTMFCLNKSIEMN